jgi:23S rRNA (guanine745-N1)-methyltransferase
MHILRKVNGRHLQSARPAFNQVNQFTTPNHKWTMGEFENVKNRGEGSGELKEELCLLPFFFRLSRYTNRMLTCPVRGCHQALVREQRRLFCAQGHSFDIARSGYINLLQPQDRKSKQPGDTLEAVAGRRRLHDLGVMEPLLEAVKEIAAPLPGDVVLDAGCGDGFYLGSLSNQMGIDAHGVDISIPAIDAAARRYPQCEWVVANADLEIPYADGSFSMVLSITARMNAPEFRRVLRPDGKLLVAIPGPEDLIELRGHGRDRVTRTLETFEPHFNLIEQRRATTTANLDAAAASDVLHSIYRPLRSQPVKGTRVTFSLDLLLFNPRKNPEPLVTVQRGPSL